jgi:hypothetical protein
MKNIWECEGCQTPNGSMCTACCTVLEIPEFGKDAGTPCLHQHPGQGCDTLGQGLREARCGGYHCSQEQRRFVLFLLTGAAALNNEVTQKEMLTAQTSLEL